MALKIRTVMTYPLTGAVDFAITFEYLARKFVTVTLIGKDRKELVLNQDYRFTTKTQITTTRTWTAADGYDSIEIRRYTSATDRLVDFADGSILRAYDLNIAQIQTLHVAEEARDLTADTIGVNNEGHLDARGRRIVNVANPIDDGDAVNLRSIKQWNDSALNSANRAKASEEEAKRQTDWAGRMRNESEQFRNEANQHRAVAESAKDQAITAKNQAESARDLASGSRSEASRFAEESNQYMSRSKQWAVNPVDVVVTDGEYSAKHWQHHSKVEADRSKREADRATTEADKLGNMNALAGAIEEVSPDHVVSWSATAKFKGELIANRSMTLRAADEQGAMGQMVHEYDDTVGRHVSNTYWAIKHPHRGEWHVPYKILNLPNDSAAWEMHFGDLMRCYNGLKVEGFNKSLDVTNQANTAVRTVAYGPGDLTQGAWVCNTRWNFYDSGLEIGWVRGGSTNGNGLIRWKPEGTQATYHDIWLNPGGVVQFPEKILVGAGGASVGVDGNIDGSLWGGNLYGWLNNRLGDRPTFAQGDGRYVRKSAGWAEVWSGSAGGGVSVGLNQDVRWRTIWIQTQGRWNPVQIGDDGAYYISSMGGWLQFTISDNGRTFRNDADRSSVPTRILVQTQ
ncbi:tail fiber protein [Escherichia phage ErnstBeyeler]|uniref:Tail fiber protein n=1 Tax=Escherichia phage ErnstBeyeler TaxID=2852038 RepID=A0AAE7VS29_9CAUD|nr:tail fiber protein [Escherichia phage ErnstBeyeler]